MIDPLLGINAPVRLLREQWRTPVELAQELYAMFTAKGPREIHDTLTIRVPQGQPALRIIHEEGDTVIQEGPTHQFGVTKASVATAPTVPGRRPRPRPSEETQRPRRQLSGNDSTQRVRQPEPAQGEPLAASAVVLSPAVEFDVPARFSSSAVFDRPIFGAEPVFVSATGQVRSFEQVIHEKTNKRGWPLMGGSSGGTPAYFGVVQGGSGAEWSITLFQDPATQEPGETVTVTIPFIADGEAAPVGVTVGPIFKIGGGYFYQPPVWLE